MTEYIIKFEKRLESIFGEETDTFKSLLNETGAVISGSIIVQSILREEWKNSDIDIYIPATDEQSPHGNPTSKIDDWLLNKLGWKMSNYMAVNRYGDSMSRGQDITWIRNFNSNNLAIPCIQLIHTRLKSNELTEYINTNFDFVICKNVYSMINKKSALLSISDVAAIVKKQFSFEFAGNIFGSLERAKKYIDRGFKIKFDSLKVLDEILAFQESQKYLDDSKKKSNTYVRICKKDISRYNCRVFYIWMKNIENYDIPDSELITRGTAATLKTDFCHEHCFMSLLGFKHFHTQGKHLGHAACENLIVINK